MGSAGALFGLFVFGYLLGVWSACLVMRQRQVDFEDGSTGHALEAGLKEELR